MINVPAARQALADILRDVVPAGCAVEAEAPDGVGSFPLALVGMPSWNADGPSYSFSTWTFPVAVIVNRSAGGGSRGSIEQLDQTWPAVLAGLRARSEDDPGLGGVCAQSVVTRSQFGLYTIGGQDFPAQMIFIDLYG